MITLELTQREKEILQHIVEGHSIPEIGELVHLSPRTVEKHRNSILRKLKFSTDDTGGAEPYSGVTFPRTPNLSGGGTAQGKVLGDRFSSN